MEYALAVVVLTAVLAMVVMGPLRQGAAVEEREDLRRSELEAAKEAKYRHIRDAELDLRMGKITETDHREADRELRAEAIVILEELDRLEPPEDRDGGRPSGEREAPPR